MKRNSKIYHFKKINMNNTQIQFYEPTFAGNFPLMNYYIHTFNKIANIADFSECFREDVLQEIESSPYLERINTIEEINFVNNQKNERKNIIYKAKTQYGDGKYMLSISHHSEESICNATLLYDKKTEVEFLIKLLKKFSTVREKEVGLIIKDEFGLAVRGFKVSAGKDFKIEDNYNEDFLKIDKKIKKCLSAKNKSGLLLLHGKPGTGKTTYIKHLADSLKKQIIFVPPMMAGAIGDPGFIPLLLKNPDSILIIEDAENVVKDRNVTGNADVVSNILNVTDGILGECLKIQIIATFNTAKTQIDAALLRKGRLLAEYKFDNLSVEKSNKLLKKLGKKAKTKEPMSLADIYYYNEDSTSTNNNNKIGFFN